MRSLALRLKLTMRTRELGLSVLLVNDHAMPLADMLARYELRYCMVANGAAIPGSYWGEPEAGLIGNTLYVRPDTPVHSALHEACHYLCMDSTRRHMLHTDAQGDDAEECAVCFLQIVLAGMLPGVGVMRLCQDMDEWGYTFRLGSAHQWYEADAAEARDWLLHRRLIDANGRPTWRKR